MSMKFDAGMPRQTQFRADNSFEHIINVNSLIFGKDFKTTIKSKSFNIWLHFFLAKKGGDARTRRMFDRCGVLP